MYKVIMKGRVTDLLNENNNKSCNFYNIAFQNDIINLESSSKNEEQCKVKKNLPLPSEDNIKFEETDENISKANTIYNTANRMAVTMNKEIYGEKLHVSNSAVKESIKKALEENNFDNKILIFDFINNVSLEINAIVLETQLTKSILDENLIKEEVNVFETLLNEEEGCSGTEIDYKNYNQTCSHSQNPIEAITLPVETSQDQFTDEYDEHTCHGDDNDDDELLKQIKCRKKSTKFENVTKPVIMDEISWSDYPWMCAHCNTVCESCDDVREHSKLLHSRCCGLQCADCAEPLVSFSGFTRHVRQHRPSLKRYCEFCNTRFKTEQQCSTHTINHWRNSKPCDRCGEILPDIPSLVNHRQLYRKCLYPTKFKRRVPKAVGKEDGFTWERYPWACKFCNLPMPNLPSLHTHGEEWHHRCFALKCADCEMELRDFKSFITHVLHHRSWLKIPCPYCSQPFERDKTPMKHIRKHETEHHKACNKCAQIFDIKSLQEHVEKFNVHGHKFSLSCDICDKQFRKKSVLKLHKTIKHSQNIPNHVCHICGRSFARKSSLKNHIILHQPKTHICEYCHMSFPTANLLKTHAKTHLDLPDPFICNECGKGYKSKRGVKLHILNSHTEREFLSCQYCEKKFSNKPNLQRHELQHSGYKPYQCKVCSLSFTNWGNCNKHMLRRHGLTLAKTKRTQHGRLRVTETGQLLGIEDGVKEWLSQLATDTKSVETQTAVGKQLMSSKYHDEIQKSD